jgi:EpsI family protein
MTWPVGAAVVLSAAFLLTYVATLSKLAAYWASNETYSYGFLVPAISGYLVWLRRDTLRDLPRSPSFVAGSIVLGLGLALLIVGRMSSTNLAEEFSLPVSVYGVVLLVLGHPITKALTFPLIYLLTMIPFWEFLTGRLHLPFQLYSAAMGVGALRLFGLPVLRQDVIIELPNITLEVAELCSGVNNLVAVLCIGVPLTHFYVRSWLKRGFILSMAIVIALLSNGVRVATVCFFAYYGIRGANGDIHGPFSLMRSLAISGVGFMVLFWLIARFADQRPAPSPPEPVTPPPTVPSTARGLALVMATVLLVAANGFERLHAITAVPLKAHLAGFPNAIDEWRYARPGSVLSVMAGDANFDQSMSRLYTGSDGVEIELLIGYFERQAQGRELIGFGLSQWLPTSSAETTMPGSGTRVRDGLTTVHGTTYHITYWYVIDGRVTTRGYEAKLWMAWTSILAGRTNAGLVVVGKPLSPGESIEASRAKTRQFVEGVMSASSRHFPQG